MIPSAPCYLKALERFVGFRFKIAISSFYPPITSVQGLTQCKMGLRIFASNWQNHNFCRHMKKSTFYIFLRDPDFANPYSSLQIHTDPYKSILVSGILPLACSIHATWGPPFSRALYNVLTRCTHSLQVNFLAARAMKRGDKCCEGNLVEWEKPLFSNCETVTAGNCKYAKQFARLRDSKSELTQPRH